MTHTEIAGADEPVYRETTERFWVLQLTTEVRHDGIYIQFEPIHRSFRHTSFEEIDEAHTTTYSASTYGGWHWGIRWSFSGNTVYRLRGNRGVELVLTDGSRIFIGSQQPTELETAITQTAKRD
jgi:hypothetical protein